MRTVQDIYDQYKINSGLQLHQLRVAAVGSLVAQAQKPPVDVRAVTLACLFHDMGNILKFDMSGTMPELFEPEGLEYWKGIQREFQEKYGPDEHHATQVIVREFGLAQDVTSLIDSMGFSRVHEVLARGSRELMIVEYADQRVAPLKVTSLRDRLEDGRKRYAARGAYGGIANAEAFEAGVQALEDIERILFEGLELMPQDINEESVSVLMQDLRKYEVA